MIKSKEGKVEIIGKREELAADLSFIFKTIKNEFGKEELKQMIKFGYKSIETIEKIEKDEEQEIKKIIKRDLPEDLAKILLELI